MIDFSYGSALGPLKQASLSKYFEWRNDYAIWKWCRQNDVLTEDGHSSWFSRVSKDPKIKMYEVLVPCDGEMYQCVGVAGLTDINLLNKTAEFSLYIGKEHAHNGFGERAFKTLLHHGFRNYGLEHIWGESFEGNPAIRMFSKVGMKEDGIRRNFYFRNGKHLNAHLYSMLRHEFEAITWLSSRG